MDTGGSKASASFVRQLHRALRHLYDPAELGASPLLELLRLERRGDPASALRRALVEAIAALKPGAGTPPEANAWRIYHILSQRYAEQFTQREVATNLALSTRQLGRLEHSALRALADYMWSRHGVTARPGSAGGKALPRTGTPSREEELAWLKTSYPSEAADVEELVQAVLKVVAPLAQALQVRLESRLPGGLPRLAVQLTTVRQALLNILTSAIRCVPGGQVEVEAELRPPWVWLRVRAAVRQAIAAHANPFEGLEMARELIGLSGGLLEVLPEEALQPFVARIGLPAAEQVAVLVIDDNADTLQLLERYLAGSRYRFVGSPDPQQALPLAAECAPQAIVLDVMLPGVDGWELLGRLREHPNTRAVPVLICTILPQEELAVALGAAGLIRKPITQEAFLAALDRVPTPARPESR